MIKNGSKIPSFCLAKIRPHVRVRSPTIQRKETLDHQKTEETSANEEKVTKSEVASKIVGRKVMIVVDSSIQAKNALQWALTHTLLTHDILLLLYVKNVSSKRGNEFTKEKATKLPGFLCSMKNTCQMKCPDVQVEILVAEGKDKGSIIVEEAKKQEVTMLVLGQKKQLFTWRLLLTWAGKSTGGGGGDIVDYCIQHATCMAVAVRRKSRRGGGYLITTKRQKDFWLLA